MPTETQKKILKLIMDNIDQLDEKWPGYRREMIKLVGDIIQHQKDFELSVSGSVVPKMSDAIDAFAKKGNKD